MGNRRRPRRSRFRERLPKGPAFLRSRPIQIGLLIAVVWMAVMAGRQWNHRRAIESEIQAMQQEIAQIEASSRTVQQALETFAQPETLEREARQRLNLARPGETVVIVPDDIAQDEEEVSDNFEESTRDAVVVTRQGTGPLVNMIAWWQYFFGE